MADDRWRNTCRYKKIPARDKHYVYEWRVEQQCLEIASVEEPEE